MSWHERPADAVQFDHNNWTDLAGKAWFKIGDFWVTRTRWNGRVLKPDFDRRVVVCGRPAGLPGSRLLGLKRAEAQQRQPVRMAFVGQ